MQLRVRKIAQAGSGGSHVTIYDADVQLIGDGVQVEVVNVDPKDTMQADVDAARNAIQFGAEKVLRPRGQGAIIRIDRLVIHPVDFKPRKYEQYTTEVLTRLLVEAEL